MLKDISLPGVSLFRLCDLPDDQLIKAVADGLIEMYAGPAKIPSRHIPACPNKDFDLLVAELILRFTEINESLELASNTIKELNKLILKSNKSC